MNGRLHNVLNVSVSFMQGVIQDKGQTDFSHVSETGHKDLSPALRRKRRMRGTQRCFVIHWRFLLDFVWVHSSSYVR